MGWSLRTNHYTQRVIGEIYENIIQYLHIYMISMYYLLIDSVTRQKSGSVGPFHGRHDFTRIQARHPQPLLEGWIGEPRLFWGVMIFRAFWDTSLRVVGVFFYAMQKWEFFFTAMFSDQKEKSCERHPSWSKGQKICGDDGFRPAVVEIPRFLETGDPVESCIKCWWIHRQEFAGLRNF